MFQIRNLSKKYGNEFALQEVSLDIGSGMNFIVGSSGSGKSTLIKIMCGMEDGYQGTVTYKNKDISTLNDTEKSYIYNNIIGFVSQDFHLIDDYTVFENILEPLYLKTQYSESKIDKVLSEVGILDIKNKKVRLLSGGQKQRVQIARELLKNPEVIICDEPTSALDKDSAKAVIDILRKISKTRSVIVVTHDLKLIEKNDTMLELDKGELVTEVALVTSKGSKLKIYSNSKISSKKAMARTKTNFKRAYGKVAIVVLSILLSSILLLSSVTGIINKSGQDEYQKLLDTYGNALLDISIHGSFMSASGGSTDDPNVDVDQNINGLYDQYVDDERLSSVLIAQAYSNIVANFDGTDYKITSSNNTPIFNEMLSGRAPENNGMEVMVPENFVELVGETNESILGKTMKFNSTVNKWEGGTFTEMPTEVELTIVGVFNSTFTLVTDGVSRDIEIKDSFFMNLNANKEIRKQAELDVDKISFIMRGKTPEDVVEIKDELNKTGIVPLGQFELLEDIVKINNQVKEQSSSATVVIGILSVLLAIAIMVIVTILRKREYAILKICGYKNSDIAALSLMESIGIMIVSLVVFLVLSPLWNIITMALFGATILQFNTLMVGISVIVLISTMYFGIQVLVSRTAKVSSTLKGGNR